MQVIAGLSRRRTVSLRSEPSLKAIFRGHFRCRLIRPKNGQRRDLGLGPRSQQELAQVARRRIGLARAA